MLLENCGGRYGKMLRTEERNTKHPCDMHRHLHRSDSLAKLQVSSSRSYAIRYTPSRNSLSFCKLSLQSCLTFTWGKGLRSNPALKLALNIAIHKAGPAVATIIAEATILMREGRRGTSRLPLHRWSG